MIDDLKKGGLKIDEFSPQGFFDTKKIDSTCPAFPQSLKLTPRCQWCRGVVLNFLYMLDIYSSLLSQRFCQLLFMLKDFSVLIRYIGAVEKLVKLSPYGKVWVYAFMEV